jgi:hypothetical protein
MAQKDLNKSSKAMKEGANKKKTGQAKTSKVSVLERIAEEKITPKSEIKVTGRKFAPIAIATSFALLSGLAVYSALSMVVYYGSFGSRESGGLLWSFILLLTLLASVTTCVWAVHRSEWGYQYRTPVVVAVAFVLSFVFGLALMQNPVENVIDRVGIGRPLRGEQNSIREDVEYGKIVNVIRGLIEVELIEGGLLRIELDSATKIFPNGIKLEPGEVVSIQLNNENNLAQEIRILPNNHPARRSFNRVD